MKTMKRIIDVALLKETLGEAIQLMFINMNSYISYTLTLPEPQMELIEVDFGTVQDEVSFQKNFTRK